MAELFDLKYLKIPPLSVTKIKIFGDRYTEVEQKRVQN